MYDHDVSIWVPLRVIGETMHRRVCPLYTFENHDRFHLIGSGVPFRIGAFRFLLTAAHVCFDSSKVPIPLFTMGADRPHALCGRRGVWEYLPGKTPDIDLSVLALDHGLADELERAYQFSTPSEMPSTTTKARGIHYLIAGYPSERNPTRNLGFIEPLATHLITSDIRETGDALLDKSDAFHFVLGHPGKTVPTHPGGRLRLPKMQGMSGGGIWQLEIDIPRKLASSPSLVGIGIEYHKTRQIFVATRVEAAIPLVKDLYRLERGLADND